MKTAAILVFFALILNSCATTRQIRVVPGKEGEIMVREGVIGDARAEARTIMKSNCGKKSPEILEEGEHVVGKISNSEEKRRNSKSITKQARTEDMREWRIKYTANS